MMRFYNGKRCVITGSLVPTDWAHILPAALVQSSDERVRQSLITSYSVMLNIISSPSCLAASRLAAVRFGPVHGDIL
jgi:hypothetical protein